MSLNDVYDIGFRHAIKVVEKNGGKVDGTNVTIKVQQPKPVRFEQSFEGHFPVEKKSISKTLTGEYEFDFTGIGFVILGESAKWDSKSTYIGKVELYVNNKLIEITELPASFTTRRHELFWKYQLPKQKYKVKVKLLNPDEKNPIRINSTILYSDVPAMTAK